MMNIADSTDETQLAEIISPESAKTINIELKVAHSNIIDYSYQYQSRTVKTSKLIVLLQSKNAEQYCLGVAKLQNQNHEELKTFQKRFSQDTIWKFHCLKLLNENPAFVHTSCRIAIDLRKSKTEATLQSASFPPAPVPTCNIADILQLRQTQRFDLMAIPSAIIEERKSSAGMRIADVRLVDGSNNITVGKEHEYASLPLTLFFAQEAELNTFKTLCW